MATKLYIGDDLISDDDGLKTELLGGASDAFDTLKEIQTSLGDDQTLSVTLTNSIATKASINNPELTGLVGINKASPNVERELDMDGNFRLLISPAKRIGGQPPALIKSTDKTGTNLRVEGPVTVTHDLFKNSGVSNGFADNSNHFHNITKINRIQQQTFGEVKNIERVQEKYYAVENNVIKNSQAAFWNWHRVTRNIKSDSVSLTNLVGWDVSAIQDFDYDASARPNGRKQTEQVIFSQSEDTTFTFTSGNNPLASGDLLQIKIEIAFAGAIVAATHFAKVTALPTTDTATVVLYGGSYKSLEEVADGNSQTALTTEFSVSKIDTSVYMTLASGTGIEVQDTTATRANAKDTFKLTFDVDHNLELNDNITILTDGDASHGFKNAEVAFVIKVNNSTEAIFVYGRGFEPSGTFSNLANISGSAIVGVLKGSIDGLHRETSGDLLMQFNADNQGRYKGYQIGPGSEIGAANCISIGKNVYNKDAQTIKIGYENEMLDIKADGITVDGSITLTQHSTGTNNHNLKLIDGDIQLGKDGDAVSFMGVTDTEYRRALYAGNDHHYVTNRHTDGDLVLMSNNGTGGEDTERLRFKAGSGVPNAEFTNCNVTATGTITSTSNTSRPVQSDETDSAPIRNIRRMNQAAYTALDNAGNTDANTLYIIIG